MKRPGEEDEVEKEKGDVEKRGGGQGEGKRDKSEEAEGRDGRMEMKSGTIKDSRLCGGSVKAGGL